MNRFVYVFILSFFLFSNPSFADGLPSKMQIEFQEPATELMTRLSKSFSLVNAIMLGTMSTVWLVMAYILIRFRRKKGVNPSKRSHNFILELLWTVLPLFLVAFLTSRNVDLIAFQNNIPKTELTLKAIGYQWYWGYEYVEKDVKFDSYMKSDADLLPGEPRLLAVDNQVVLPINTNIKLQTTAADVIHSWAMPAFGIKLDAIPGRLNERWFNIKKTGIYYGQCSELCGRLHGFMPIVVKAVKKEEFDNWISSKKTAN